ncbi:hypothetical protein [Thermotalea metallivorans]|uniref:Uncharacterized protein n=1 Tax=Thermotalea metallivorans TaxID=520762 RepID=A0A140L271_9FIRM|nr:hypothetical protein [Thermotalea metallivorans]KXG74646.1 hypothetical protein AN619_22330 [Thermotalea metallivorans]
MKKRVIFLFLISFITLTYIFTKQNIFGKTIEEVLPSVNSKPVNILHEEKIDRGMIVFYNHLNGNDLSVAILKKN